MSWFLFAWQISHWAMRGGALCTFLWGWFHNLLPDLSMWEGFWLLLPFVVLALAPPSVLSSSACGETSSSLGAVLGLCQPLTQRGAASFLRRKEPGAYCKLPDYCTAQKLRDAPKIVFTQHVRKVCVVHWVVLMAGSWEWHCLCVFALLTWLIQSKNCTGANSGEPQAAHRQVNESTERSHPRNTLVVFDSQINSTIDF